MNLIDLAGARLLLDADLIVLLCAGMAGPSRIARHKSLSSCDFAPLRSIVASALEVVISPNVAAEASNLGRQASGASAEEVALTLGKLAESARAHYMESKVAIGHADYPRLGLTDAALLQIPALESGSTLLLTADHELHVAALRRGLKAVNFNHIRDQRNDFR